MKIIARHTLLASLVGLSFFAGATAHASDLSFGSSVDIGSYGVIANHLHSTMPAITLDGSVTYGKVESHLNLTRAQGQSINGFVTDAKVSTQYNNVLDSGKMVVAPKLTYGDFNMRTNGGKFHTQYVLAGLHSAYTHSPAFSTFADVAFGRNFAPSVTGYRTSTSGLVYQACAGVKVNAGIGVAVLSVDYKRLPFGNEVHGSNGIDLSTVLYNAGYEVKF